MRLVDAPRTAYFVAARIKAGGTLDSGAEEFMQDLETQARKALRGAPCECTYGYTDPPVRRICPRCAFLESVLP